MTTLADMGALGKFSLPSSAVTRRKNRYSIREISEMLNEAGVKCGKDMISRIESGRGSRVPVNVVLAYLRVLDVELAPHDKGEAIRFVALHQDDPIMDGNIGYRLKKLIKQKRREQRKKAKEA